MKIKKQSAAKKRIAKIKQQQQADLPTQDLPMDEDTQEFSAYNRSIRRPANKRKQLIMLGIGIILVCILIIGYLLYKFSQDNQQAIDAVPETPPAATAPQPTEDAALPEQPVDDTVTDDISIAAGEQIAVDDIVNAPLPSNQAIAAEELDRLADQRQNYGEREQALQEQVKLLEELTQKKAEQIDLLEQQIKQAEADLAASPAPELTTEETTDETVKVEPVTTQ